MMPIFMKIAYNAFISLQKNIFQLKYPKPSKLK
jgi:hypothetical protein